MLPVRVADVIHSERRYVANLSREGRNWLVEFPDCAWISQHSE
jgi:hypothetical protein